MEVTTILALDPGHTTGACLIRTAPTDKGFEVLWCDEIAWNDRFQVLRALIDGRIPMCPPPRILVMEQFRLRQGRAFEQSGSEMPSSQVIGIAQAFWWIQWQELTGMYFQEPGAMVRVMIPEEDLFWTKGSPHKQDAYRHARYFYLMNLRVAS